MRPGLVCLRLNVVVESSAQQFEGFLNLGGDAFLKIGLHLRRDIVGLFRALLPDLGADDRETFERGSKKTERQKSIGRGERRHVERLEPRGDDIDEPVIKRQRRASGVIELAKVKGAAG